MEEEVKKGDSIISPNGLAWLLGAGLICAIIGGVPGLMLGYTYGYDSAKSAGWENLAEQYEHGNISLSEQDKNFIINVALQAPTYSDWCIMNGGTWMPTNQKETYLPITKQEAGQLMQQGKEPIQDSNGNYYAKVITIERICGLVG